MRITNRGVKQINIKKKRVNIKENGVLTNLKELIFLIYMTVGAYEDIKTRSINLPLSVLSGIIGLILSFVTGQTVLGMAVSLLPGLILMLLSLVSGESIGRGDAVFIIICGTFNKAADTFRLTVIAWVLCACVALIMCIGRAVSEKSVKAALPFAAVFLAGYFIDRIFSLRL